MSRTTNKKRKKKKKPYRAPVNHNNNTSAQNNETQPVETQPEESELEGTEPEEKLQEPKEEITVINESVTGKKEEEKQPESQIAEDKKQQSEPQIITAEEKNLSPLQSGWASRAQTIRAYDTVDTWMEKLPHVDSQMGNKLMSVVQNALTARAAIDAAESGKQFDMSNALSDVVLGQVLSRGIESGDPQFLETVSTVDGLDAMKLQIQETALFRDMAQNIHTKEEAQSMLASPAGKSNITALTDSFSAHPQAKYKPPKQEAPKEEAPKEEAPKREAPEQKVPAQEAPKQEVPAQKAPVQEAPKKEELKTGPQPKPLLEVPKMHSAASYSPQERAVNAKEAGSLTRAMNDMIRDELGYDTIGEGKQKTSSKELGRNRLLEVLSAKGELLDKDGNPIKGDVMRESEETAKYFDKKLRDGESFFIYARHELYPREISYDKGSGQLKCSEPLSERPEKPGPEADKKTMQAYQRRALAYEKFSHGPNMEKRIARDELLRQQKEEIDRVEQANREIEAYNANLKKRPDEKDFYNPQQAFSREVPVAVASDNSVVKTSEAQRVTDAFALAVGKQMGYGEMFRRMGGGTLPLSQLATDGVIIAADGSDVVMPEAIKEQAMVKEFGEKLMNGESFFVRRLGEELPRRVSFDREKNSIVIGDQLTAAPEEVSAPTRWQRFTNVFRKNKAVAAYEQYQKQQKLFEMVHSSDYQRKVMERDTYLREQQARQEAAKKAEQDAQAKKAQQQEKLRQEQDKARYGKDLQERIDRRVEEMATEYEYHHPDKPLSKVGRENIVKLCTNYEKARADLEAGRLQGRNGAGTVRDIMAYELAKKGVGDEKGSRLLGEVNNPHYAKNMQEVAKSTGDYRYMVRDGHDAAFYQKALAPGENMEKINRNAYMKAVVLGRKVDEKYRQNKMANRKESISQEMIDAMKKGDYDGLKKAMQAQEKKAQNSLKSTKELAKNFKNVTPKQNKVQSSKPMSLS